MRFETHQHLIDAIKEDRLVIFAGAGLSKSCGLDDWKTIVRKILIEKSKYIEKSSDILNALEADIITPLEALDKTKSEKRILLEYFESALDRKIESSTLHEKLKKISRRFVTTNFDSLIETFCCIDTVITQDSSYNLSKIDSERDFVLKIHGDIKKIDSCVIFSDQYKQMYENNNLATFQLKKIFSEYTVLFIGFSFNDQYVKELFDFVSGLLDGYGPKHYLISTENKNIKNIICINIESHENTADYIEHLSEHKEQPEKTPEPLLKNIEKEIDGSDIPPNISGWVGREQELALLRSDSFKVIFITGIGGQGKSSLASYYISEEKSYSIIDWRDFKEEGHKFHHKVISMTTLLNNKITPSELIGLSDSELVTQFFKTLGDKKAIFVLDNIDSYIDLERFEPINGIGELFKSALNLKHNAKFIFTCRPFIHHAEINFFQLKLSGLSESDTIAYFMSGIKSIAKNKINSYAKRAHKLTNGHALWLSLILAQSRRGEHVLNSFLNNIESGVNIEANDSSILSQKVLKNIWSSLHERDKLVLRTLAESVVAETSDDYAEILKGELNYKNFQKALRALGSLNLIIEKRDTSYIELHPIVKEFVRKNYPTSDRKKYISLFVEYYDRIIFILKPKLSYKLSFQEFSNFTSKAELSINAGDFQNAISSLWEVYDSMCAAGYIEEYLRVSRLLFQATPWSKRAISSFTNFENLLQATAKNATEYGDNDFSYFLIEKFSSIIEKKESEYIRLCEIRSYCEWFKGNHTDSIDICDEAIYLIERSNQEDRFNIKHNRALAYRDTSNTENVEKALEFFLKNRTIEELLEPETPDKIDGSIYGNVGKCLSILGRRKDAITCYCKSFSALFNCESNNRLINLGYASFWIAEEISKAGSIEVSAYFFKYSLELWSNSSPVLAKKNQARINSIATGSTCQSIMSQDFWRVEKFCTEWVKKELRI